MLADGQWGSDLRAYISSSLIIEHDPYDEYAAEPLLAGSNGTDYPRRRSSFDLHYVRARLGYAHAAAEDETDVETACDAMGGAGTNVADGHLDEYINTDPRTGAVTGLSVMRRTWRFFTRQRKTPTTMTTGRITGIHSTNTAGAISTSASALRKAGISATEDLSLIFSTLSIEVKLTAPRRTYLRPVPWSCSAYFSNFHCDKNCDVYDDVLEEGVTSIPVIFRQDPSGGLHDVLCGEEGPVST